ncbi:MAG: VOC family protein [Cyanobacteriota bacterium]
MSISEIAHVNIVVSNMEQSIKFYRDLLNFKIILDKEISSPELSKGVGLENVHARVTIFKLSEGNALLELFEYKNPAGKNAGINPPNTIPLNHIAFKVKKIKPYYESLKRRGVEFVSEPQTIADGVSFCYFRDPDGALLELIEFPE